MGQPEVTKLVLEGAGVEGPECQPMERALLFYPRGLPERLKPGSGPNIADFCCFVWGTS